jgi:hypothetical protein
MPAQAGILTFNERLLTKTKMSVCQMIKFQPCISVADPVRISSS